MHLNTIVVATLLLLLPQPGATQSEPDIIIEQSRNRDKQIQDFVEALTPTRGGRQIGRYERPVCPAATGLSDEQNQRVVDRMREVAKEARIPLAKTKCGPNVIVVVVDGKDEFVAALRKEYPAFFTSPLGRDIVISKQVGSAVAWHIEGMLDSNGNDAGIQLAVDKLLKGFKVSSLVQEQRKNYFTDSTDGSRIKPSSRPHFISGIVIVERSALAGLETTQLADYAAMRLYGETDPERMEGSLIPTILTVIDSPMNRAIPLTLTKWDMTFLKSLYAIDGLRFAAGYRAAIRQRFRQELRGTEK